ncbi:hypothetical protein BASA81_002062 [Batrachochytrium salamandrivorans]|nr:hypothetical protein BASA81_002062 [Batrachochytrium salamandrivorans]
MTEPKPSILTLEAALRKVYLNANSKTAYRASTKQGKANDSSKINEVASVINLNNVPLPKEYLYKAAIVVVRSEASKEKKKQMLTRLIAMPSVDTLADFNQYVDEIDNDIEGDPNDKIVTSGVTESINKEVRGKKTQLIEDISKLREFVRHNFRVDSGEFGAYNGPDVDSVLLDEESEEEEEEEDQEEDDNDDDDEEEELVVPNRLTIAKEGEPDIQPDAGPKSQAEEDREEYVAGELEKAREGMSDLMKAARELQAAREQEKLDKMRKESESGVYREQPMVNLPMLPFNVGLELIRELGVYNDDIITTLRETAYFKPEYLQEVYEDLAAKKYTASDFITLDILASQTLDIQQRAEARLAGQREATGEELRPEVATLSATEVVDLTDDAPPPDNSPGSNPPDQPIITQHVTKEIYQNVKRYHPKSLMLYFGSYTSPDWDTELAESIKSIELSEEEIDYFSDAVIKEYGPKIFVEKRKSSSREEMNELIQLQFCVMRNLNKGPRFRTANVKLSDLDKLKQASAASQAGPRIVNAPVQPATIITGETLLKVDEAEAKFQTAFNNRTTDLDGRSLKAVGAINHTKFIQEGPLPDVNIFSPPNVIDSSIKLRTRTQPPHSRRF